MPEGSDWTDTVRALLGALRDTDVVELRYARRGLRLRLRRRPTAAGRAEGEAVAPEATPGELHTLCAPLTGVFYRAPAPDAEPYVREGEWVEAGRVVGLIEAMKVFNEVQADVAGRAVRFLVASGQLVQQGAPLLHLAPRAPQEESA
ncbi:MAG: biotin carboxyl carrier domain-containing protein [Chloroflexi bacterium]|mgnify:CR=1 FL=1|nr:biotin carboxyl carrier domain-containing protein [Chloroflexota bacterium]